MMRHLLPARANDPPPASTAAPHLLSPGETKPVYIDFDSPVLTRILCRLYRRASADCPGRPVRFTEMLPGPDDCWLADEDGRHHTSELRLVAVDLARRAQGSTPADRRL
jgi:hypothetical protein